jgi:hypothetical protein
LVYKEIVVYETVSKKGEGIITFGQHVKKAWKNIYEIKPKKKAEKINKHLLQIEKNHGFQHLFIL